MFNLLLSENLFVFTSFVDKEISEFLSGVDSAWRMVCIDTVKPFISVFLRMELVDIDWKFLSFKSRNKLCSTAVCGNCC